MEKICYLLPPICSLFPQQMTVYEYALEKSVVGCFVRRTNVQIKFE